MSTDITQIDAKTDITGHVTAPRCRLGSPTCNFEITYKDNDPNKPLEMYVTLPIKYATKTNKSGYQKYSMRSIIEAIQELNRRTATFSCNAYMKTAIDMFDTADNDVKIFYCDQETDGLPAVSNGDAVSLIHPLRLIVKVYDGGSVNKVIDDAGEYTVKELSMGWDKLKDNSESFRQLVNIHHLELNCFQPFNINAIDYETLTYTVIYEVPPPISLDVQYKLRIGEQISTDTWSGDDIWYHWDDITSSERFKNWATGKPCSCPGIEYLHPQSSDIDNENHIVDVPYKHYVFDTTAYNKADSILFKLKLTEGVAKVSIPMGMLYTAPAAYNNDEYKFTLLLSTTPPNDVKPWPRDTTETSWTSNFTITLNNNCSLHKSDKEYDALPHTYMFTSYAQYPNMVVNISSGLLDTTEWMLINGLSKSRVILKNISYCQISNALLLDFMALTANDITALNTTLSKQWIGMEGMAGVLSSGGYTADTTFNGYVYGDVWWLSNS